MGKITILPDTLCNQIAAGEVIERPAAAVKELVENSIDAGSRKISVTVLQGGRKEIRVVDNGSGMNPDDALLALERHATSKINNIYDLQSIRSMGFRGEALPSIAAVSRFELITREPEAVSGIRIRVEGGVLKDVKETGCPSGTMVTIRDLFHNIPARRKFLRSPETETAHINEQFIRLSMANPQIHFSLTHGERLQYDFSRANKYAIRAGQIMGTAVTAKLKQFSVETKSGRIEGLVGPPDLLRTSGHSIFVFVNGRPVWDRMLNHAILNAYDASIPKGKYPLAVLFLEVPANIVDVNVHPTKREVRFHNPGDIMEVIRTSIRKALETFPCRASRVDLWRSPSSRESFHSLRSQYSRETQVSLKNAVESSFHREIIPPPFQEDACTQVPSDSGQMLLNDTEKGAAPSAELLFSRLPIIGQLANTYILLEAPDGLIVIDQHAAHERLVYEQLSQEASKGAAGQRLTRPVVLEVSPREAVTLGRWLDHLAALGFEIESFGGDSFVMHAVPAVLGDYPPQTLIQELLETAHEEENAPRLDLLAHVAKTAACHGAVRAGQKLGLEEIRYLLSSLDRTCIPVTCPHGRPWCRKVTLAEIARFFRRT